MFPLIRRQAVVPLLLLLALAVAQDEQELHPGGHHHHPAKPAPGGPREKHCRAASPEDDGWISQCVGSIKCPETCPRCRLSCRFCGMVYCPRCNKEADGGMAYLSSDCRLSRFRATDPVDDGVNNVV